MNPQSFTSVQKFHTHTHPAFGRVVSLQWGEDEDERGMKMKWEWKWDEWLLNRVPRRGSQKKREGENKHQHPWPGAGKPWKGKEKEKRRSTDTEQDQRRGGRTLGQARKPTPTSAREGPTYLGREERMKWGTTWGTSWWTEKTTKIKGDSVQP